MVALPPRPQRFILERPCPKCGTGPTPSRFCSLSWMPYFEGYHPEFIDGDHMHRGCLHCGHERIELALDQPLFCDDTRSERQAETRASLQTAVVLYHDILWGRTR